MPLPVSFFAAYGDWFARRAVPAVDERTVVSVAPAPEGPAGRDVTVVGAGQAAPRAPHTGLGCGCAPAVARGGRPRGGERAAGVRA
ncbi:hypothetical protein [Streptomyces sp. NE5-10]|uniref:hypothetical protein n=1 Tax=Streptomyces sp. NE5-10 TaxID=2759674 RepID=UPI0027DD1922|nr:hypothetical protein [Streptomyces sp. NE5-10]